MVEFGTGNYPGDAHVHLSLLDKPDDLKTFKSKIADSGLTNQHARIRLPQSHAYRAEWMGEVDSGNVGTRGGSSDDRNEIEKRTKHRFTRRDALHAVTGNAKACGNH